MAYSAHFFLVDPDALPSPKSEASNLVAHVIQHVRRQRPQVAADDLQLLQEWVLAIARQEWPSDESSAPYEALLWILDSIGEKVHLAAFINFRQFNYSADTALWRSLRETPQGT